MLPEHIRLGIDLEEGLVPFLQENNFSKIAVLVDENTEKHCYPILQPILEAHVLINIESGEENKTLATCERIWQVMTDHAFDRKALLLNLGGGVIGDMGGFCASAYKRGISFANLPTTLLSQVDASIGGKLGVDFGPFKNHIGFFKDPQLILVNPRFLETLPQREVRSGFAEVIKHSLIADAEYWKVLISSNFEGQPWHDHVLHSIQTKQRIVKEDPHEKGVRKILNFGHTIGHAIEGHLLKIPKRKLLHGEAIAIGMVCEAFLSHKKLGLPLDSVEEIVAYLRTVYSKVMIDSKEIDDITKLAWQDKKNSGNKIQASLLKSIGDCAFDVAITPDETRQSIEYYQSQM